MFPRRVLSAKLQPCAWNLVLFLIASCPNHWASDKPTPQLEDRRCRVWPAEKQEPRALTFAAAQCRPTLQIRSRRTVYMA
ncbi:hypothetical protein CONPUDRAFT_82432 [Coniophora puteana RWD-64-598 SS2]|uniref:Secreted protein n=1 Tax=Coniophora puteana (strain RWD-64-598) TaxID=741705 RepID=A0A5M3MS36_CONPW|nr:uncharacterized protein CONPUDRAFT_82432 [Coniophora puteana RWD-64-598 SS2]EIW81554.1 hypothetical protein CONPUDRAFT_82432 [Coniophora puteana RWD-64-598 SS2]